MRIAASAASLALACGCGHIGFDPLTGGSGGGDGGPGDGGGGTGPTFIHASSGANDGANVTFPHVVLDGSDRLLVVGAHVASKSYTTASVSYAGIALAQIDASITANTTAEDCSSTMWYLVDPPVGTANVIATLETSTRPMASWAMSFTGVDPTAPIGNSEWTVGSLPTVSAAASVVSAPDELVVDNYCMAIAPPRNLTPGTGQVERMRQDDTSNEMRVAGSTRPGAAAVTMAWTFGNAYYTLRAAALRPAH